MAIELKHQLGELLKTPKKSDSKITWFPLNDRENPVTEISLDTLMKTTFPPLDVDEDIVEEVVYSMEPNLPPRESIDWLPNVPFEKDEFLGSCTNIDDDCILYIHSYEQSKISSVYIEDFQLIEICLFRQGNIKFHRK